MPSWKSGKDQVSVAALGDQTAIATSTRRSALENNPADDVTTKHVAIERVARRRGGLRRDATHESDLRRLPSTTSSVHKGTTDYGYGLAPVRYGPYTSVR
jgi:hypothetical protein